MVHLVSFYHRRPEEKSEAQLGQSGFHDHRAIGLWARALNHEAGKNLLMGQVRVHRLHLPDLALVIFSFHIPYFVCFS